MATHFKGDWFAERRAFEQAIGKRVEEANIYCHIRGWRSDRLTFDFHYLEPTLSQERFELLYTRRPVVLRGLRLQGHAPGQEMPFPLAPALGQCIEEQWIPLLILRAQDEGRLRALLFGREIVVRILQVSFADGVVKYPAIVGTAAFIVHAELERYLRYRERLEDNAPFIVG